MLGVFHVRAGDVVAGLLAMELAFESVQKLESVRFEWEDPFLWVGTNVGHVWTWCRLMPGLADAPERLPSMDVPVSVFDSWLGTGHRDETMTIEVVDPEIVVSRPDGGKARAAFKPAKWPQFRIADRIVETLPPRIDPDRKSNMVSLGWLPVEALETLLRLSVVGKDEALVAASRKGTFNVHVAFEKGRTIAASQCPHGMSVAAVGVGTETQYELSVPFLAARAVARGVLSVHRHRRPGWAAVLMGMPRFKEWWASFVAGDGGLRVGVSAPSGYDDELQLLVLGLPDVRLDTAFITPGGPPRWSHADAILEPATRGEKLCVKLVAKRAELSMGIRQSTAQGIVYGPSGERCVKHSDFTDAMQGVTIDALGWFGSADAENLWLRWRSKLPHAGVDVVGLRIIPAGPIKAPARPGSDPANFRVDPHPGSGSTPRLHINDGLFLDLFVYVDGQGSNVWRTSPEFRDAMASVFRSRRVWRDMQKMAPADSHGKNLWDIDANAGIIEGSGGTKYIVLPDGEVTILADTADGAKLQRARKFLHEG